MNSLELFDPLTAQWFSQSLGMPTAVQEAAWPSIAAGKNTLVSAPTGTGKTLSAFLVFIDKLKAQERNGTLKQELQLIYVSPLKALASDIRENLRRPLDGITKEEIKTGVSSFNENMNISVMIRTGDTPQNERRRMIKSPPQILITTPESLYLMLTSQSGKKTLSTARWVIIDELHAIIDSKRGAHLMLSLARLDKLCHRPLQRIGLSATIQPVQRAAEYLSPDPVAVINPPMRKDVRLTVANPFSDGHVLRKDTAWQEIAGTIVERCQEARSVIVFVEGRAYAEKITYYINQLAGDGFARAHHGSLSKEQRYEVENALRTGSLRVLCATSSMELGIDVGEIDQVLQVGCPRSISSTMQRLGRAGHSPNRTSVMYIYPRSAPEGLYCGLTAQVVRDGGIEFSKPPILCLDVLSQHLVSMAVGNGYTVDEVMEILPRAYSFRDVTKDDVCAVLCMLAGDYEHEKNIPVRPRVLYDRIHERVEGDTYSRMLAVLAGGTIPDKGMYTARTENGVKIGELDEEFIFESRVGDTFLLGTFAWQITHIQKDTVTVRPSTISGARLPFWHGDIKGRRMQTGQAFGAILRKLSSAYEDESIYKELHELGLDEIEAENAFEFVKRQIAATGVLPDDRTIVIEHFHDENDIDQLMVHSVFGQQVNAPLAILTAETARQYINVNVHYVEDDNGFMLFPYDKYEFPEGLLQQIPLDKAENILNALLPATPLFTIAFRYNAARSLMFGMQASGRQPLWVQRLRSAEMLDSLIMYENHPLIRETKRECLEDYWDLPGLKYVLNGIRTGAIRVREIYSDAPSPMSLPLAQQTEAAMMYDYTPTTTGVQLAATEALKNVQMMEPSPEQLERVSARRNMPKDEKQLHSLLMIEGDIVAGELDVPIEWLEKLVRQEQASYIEPGLWIAAEQNEKYRNALYDGDMDAMKQIVLRLLRYRGAQSPSLLSERYFWPEKTAQDVLSALCQEESAVENDGLYYHAELYNRARKETVKSRRLAIKTLPSERYASLLSGRIRITAPAAEQLEIALKLLCDQVYPLELWKSILLPARAARYSGELLDSLLAQGNLFWHITPGKGLSFHNYEDIDWDADLSEKQAVLEGNEKILYDALLKRGACFMHRLFDLLNGESPYDTLQNLAEKGLVNADSFVPVRQMLSRDKLKNGTPKQRVNARVKALTSGRWELSHPLKELSIEQQLERAFDRSVIVCKETFSCSLETMQGLTWGKALETLRVWEYTGRVRRGYFIEGLSGVQFIRDKDFNGTMFTLEHPQDEIVWLPAVDPCQPWGKCLPHKQDRSFMNLPGTAVALQNGIPAAVFERKGKVLRIFDSNSLTDILHAFVMDYKRQVIYPMLNRITLKQYPNEAVETLISVGFRKEMQDFVLYRGGY